VELWNIGGFDVYLGEIILTMAIVCIFMFINIKAVKVAFVSQTFLAIAQTMIIFVFPIIIIATGKADFSYMKPLFEGSKGESVMSGIGVILSMAPWAFVGFDVIPQVCEEFEFDQAKTKALMVMTIISAWVMYSCTTLTTAIVRQEGYASWAEYLNSNPFWATGSAVETALGKPGLYILGFAMACAVLSAINGFFIASTRLLAAMANRKALPKFFAKRTAVTGAPVNATFFVGAIALIGPWFGRTALSWIVDMTSAGTSIVFTYVCMAAWKFAKRENNSRMKVFGILGALCGVVFLLLLIIPGMVPLTQNLGIEMQRAQNLHKYRSIIYGAMAIGNLAISIWLCQYLGAIGCAIGTAVAVVLANGLVMNIFYQRRLNIDVTVFWKNISRMALGLLPPAACGVLMMLFVNLYSIPMLLGGIVVYTAIYCASVWLLSMNGYEKALVGGMVRKVLRK